MKVCFSGLHKHWGGLACNGGSQTILKSAEALRSLGHKVDVAATVDRFKWFKHPKPVKKIPKDADAVVAISISDVDIVMKKARNKMAYWARPFEFWQMPKNEIIKTLKRFARNDGLIFCNSSWQVKWLEKYDIPSILQFAGIDFDRWEKYKPRCPESPIICTLYHKHPRKQFKKAGRLAAMDDNEWRVLGKGVWVTGKKLVDFYNQCNIWFAPTRLEGFHNVPVEAALCGCLIVCMNEPKNGMMDYCNDETAHVCDSLEEAAEAIKNPDYDKVKKMDAYLRIYIGTRDRNMKRFAGCLK